MPRKCKYTKEELINAALDIVRNEGFDSLSARNLTRKLGATQATIFTHFSSMDEINENVREQIVKTYDEYINEGLQMKPSFKGIGMKMVQFAKDESEFYRVLFVDKKHSLGLNDYLHKQNHYDKIVHSAMETFNIDKPIAEELFKQLMIYTNGIENLIVNDIIQLNDSEIASLYGMAARAFLREIQSPKDERVKILPSKENELELPPEDYLK